MHTRTSSTRLPKKSSLSFIASNVNLSEQTYYRMGGQARFFASPKNVRELANAIFFAREQLLPFAVLGTGSNSVFSDEVFPGVVISLHKLCHFFWENENLLFAQAGVSNTEIAEQGLEQGYCDAHWMFRMPGLLGASIRMNAKCYGGETSQIVTEIHTIDPAGNTKIYAPNEVFIGYKKTSLMDSPEIVIGARIQFVKKELQSQILEKMLQCEADRHKKHHFDHPSCGSTFKNNYAIGRPSGALFDELQLKGTKVGNCEVSEHHANFVWNKGNAKAMHMLELANAMRQTALKAGYDLELEVQPVGLFHKALYADLAMQRLAANSVPRDNAMLVGCSWAPELHSVRTQQPFGAAPLSVAPFGVAVFEGVPVEYFRKSHAGLPGVKVKVEQQCTLLEAQENPDKVFLKWTTEIQDTHLQDFLLLPCPAPAKSFVPELWHYSVSELFLAHCDWLETKPKEQQASYFEFEITPQEHWLALEFSQVRQRTSRSQTATADLWVNVKRFSRIEQNAVHFGMEFNFNAVRALLPLERKEQRRHEGGLLRVPLLFQCCFSLGHTKYFLAPHWEVAGSPATHDYGNTPAQPADFHQPSKFATLWLF